MNIWDENVDLKTEDAIRLIEEQFNMKIKDIFFVASGWDNDVYKVDDKYIFRFPRRAIANQLIEKEGKSLPIIKRYVSTIIPNPVFYGKPTSYYPYNFLGYDYTHDYNLDEIDAINGVDSILILATFLSQLHSVPIDKVESIVGYDDLDRLNVAKRKETLTQNGAAINKTGVYDTSKLETYIKELTDITLDNEKVLIHGDMHIRNLLYNINGVVSSVIDFGDIHIGHRAGDISIVYSMIPLQFRSTFFNEYGNVSDETLLFARFKAIFTNAYLLLTAYDLKNITLVKKIIISLDNALS